MNKKPLNGSKKRNDNKNIIIKVAILAEEPFFWGSRKFYHKIILDNYTWLKDDIRYTITTKYLYDKDIINGELNTSKYDTLLVPGGGIGNNEALTKGLTFRKSVKKFKQNIANFIKQGGGYIGICGGVALITDLKKDSEEKPQTITERLYNKSSLGVSCVSSYFKCLAFPLFYPFQYKHPEKIGNSAYSFTFAPGETVDGKYIYAVGCPLDVDINRDNPIFSDFTKEKERIRWWAGQALIIPKDPDREVYVLGKYPSIDVSENESTKICAWRYTGGILGIFSGILKAFKTVKKNNMSLNKVPLFTFYLAGGWECSGKVVKLGNSNLPCMTAEIYPNNNKGRIVLCSLHTEYMVWNGGHIEENENLGDHCLGKGLHRWKNIDKLSDSLEKEMTNNWWMLRRFVAWASKVPDNHLPPIEPGKITKEVEDLIKNHVYWDGNYLTQLKNI
ncbi:hypothetical protein AYK24_04755 [Thermoplasmatales archaeon SG8-52-4]|nr:MAG: hypothetical protein AYK24_04755 [Thermoplasmatales archaeon SG8-52-4]